MAKKRQKRASETPAQKAARTKARKKTWHTVCARGAGFKLPGRSPRCRDRGDGRFVLREYCKKGCR